jgi:hypothetical protein
LLSWPLLALRLESVSERSRWRYLYGHGDLW